MVCKRLAHIAFSFRLRYDYKNDNSVCVMSCLHQFTIFMCPIEKCWSVFQSQVYSGGTYQMKSYLLTFSEQTFTRIQVCNIVPLHVPCGF